MTGGLILVLARCLQECCQSLILKTTTMKELRNKYFALKTQAMDMMRNGNINGYLAKLVEVNDVRLQLVQVKSAV